MAASADCGPVEHGRRWIETQRIKQHLRRVERDLRAADTDHLTARQAERRGEQLDRLREYREQGAFPLNQSTAERTPLFVGSNEVPCAMAYLLLEDGREELVDQVRQEDNTVLIEELEDGPVLDWIHDHGLTQEEAARIQPAYGGSVTIKLAQSCGPVGCGQAAVAAHIVAAGLFLGLEYIGFKVASQIFPGNTLKRRGAFGYFTVMNLLLAPLTVYMLYTLLL